MTELSPILPPILYAEDDDNDIYLMERAFGILGIQNSLRSVTDGKKAVAYLSGAEPYTDGVANPLPCFMLLDLSMPGRTGIEILKWIGSQPKLAKMPVVVLSSSNQVTDIHRAYLLGAVGFFTKPGDPDALLHVVGAIKEYWLDENRVRTGFLDIGAFRHPIAPL